MKKKLALIALVVLLSLIISNNLGLANSNDITDIKVNGNNKIKDLTILKEINTQIGDPILNEQLKKDLQAIYDLGYFSNVKINFQHYNSGVRLIFNVIENPIISKIEITGNQMISNKKIKELITIKTNKILDINKLKKGIKAINKHYEKQGYVLAEVVEHKIQNKNELYIKINEGKLNKIKIEGNSKTKDFVILRELDIKEGEVFNVNKIKQDLKDIQQLKLFKTVKPKFQKSQSGSQEINLIIQVSEKRTNSFKTGLTHSPNTGVAGLIDLTFKNYFGRAKKIRTKWEYGANKNYYEIGFSDPWASWLFERRTSLDFSLYNRKETLIDDDNVKKRGGELSIGRQFTDEITSYLNIDVRKTKEEDQNNWEDDRILTLRTTRNTTGKQFTPRNGSKQTFSIKKAGLLGGDNNYTKYELDLRKYFPSSAENSWAVRLKIAGSNGDLPDSERYYLSGRDGVRGYENKYFDENEDTNYDPTKEGFVGNSVLLSSIEYRYPIINKLRGIAFADVGKTFSSGDLDLSKDDFKYSIGAGLRIKTPIGELGLDYGYAPEASQYSNSELQFTIGNQF